MTNGRKNFVRIVFVSLCFYPAVTTQAGSLSKLIEEQDAALSALEKRLAGRNPYVQVRTAHDAMGTVRQSSENVARESRKIEQERATLAEDNRQLVSGKTALLKEVQGLQVASRNLVTANENLASERTQLVDQNERLVTRQRFLSMAFFVTLALAFLGFGGLLVRIPNSRLERRLKQLEITDLENKLKKEASTSRAPETSPRSVKRPLAELMSADIRQSQAEPPRAHAKRVRPERRNVQAARADRSRVVALDDKAIEKKAGLTTPATKPGKAEEDTKKGEIKQKQKKKKN